MKPRLKHDLTKSKTFIKISVAKAQSNQHRTESETKKLSNPKPCWMLSHENCESWKMKEKFYTSWKSQTLPLIVAEKQKKKKFKNIGKTFFIKTNLLFPSHSFTLTLSISFTLCWKGFWSAKNSSNFFIYSFFYSKYFCETNRKINWMKFWLFTQTEIEVKLIKLSDWDERRKGREGEKFLLRGKIK